MGPVEVYGIRYTSATKASGGTMHPEHDDQAGRKQIHVKVCPSSWDGWDLYAQKQGVTLAALLDAIGHYLAAGEGALAEGPVTEAREIDRDRRRRG